MQLWAKQAAQLPEMQSLYGVEIKSCRFDSTWVSEFKKNYNILLNSGPRTERRTYHQSQLADGDNGTEHHDVGSYGLYYSTGSVFVSDHRDIQVPDSPPHEFPIDSLGPGRPLADQMHMHNVPAGIVVGAMSSTAADASLYLPQDYIALQPLALDDTQMGKINRDLWGEDVRAEEYSSWRNQV